MPLTPRTATPYPAATDAPDGPAQMAALATQLEKFAVPKFASAAARDSAIASPAEGDMCFRTDTRRYESYSATVGGWIGVIELGVTNATAYTPTLTGLTVGTGGLPTNVGRWVREGNFIDVEAIITLGTTGFSVGTGFTISLPFPADSTFNQSATIIGISTLSDATGPLYPAPTVLIAASTVETRYQSTASATASSSLGQCGATSPFTWAASDRITMKARYRVAT